MGKMKEIGNYLLRLTCFCLYLIASFNLANEQLRFFSSALVSVGGDDVNTSSAPSSVDLLPSVDVASWLMMVRTSSEF